MIHRLALLMGGTGAAGVLAAALVLGGFGSPLPNSPEAFVPVSNNALAGGQRPAEAPTDQPTMTTSLGGGAPQDGPKEVVDTVYVLPAPATQPDDSAREPSDDHNGGNQADRSSDDNHSGGGEDGGNHEPSDD